VLTVRKTHREPQSHEWADSSTARLRVLWAEGAGTRQIGAELGISKNAVIGKARRLGLDPRPNPKGVRPGQPLPAPRPRPTPYRPVVRLEPQQKCAMGRRPPAPPPPAPPQPPAAPQSDVRRCQWPVTHDKPWRFCGEPTAPGRPYCAAHTRIAYIPGRWRMLEAAA
jgi:GcrA cell cycle regulator